MGVNLKEIVPVKEIELSHLANKRIAIDAYNMLYQFLSNIRQVDGTPLMDSEGRITSHLVGMFFRTANLLSEGILPVFVFDGKPPEEKFLEQEKRKKAKEEAREKYEEARQRGDIEEMKKYASRISMLNSEMVQDAKRLATLLGCPVVQAPSEGEAQAAFMAKQGDIYAVASQDYDSLLFGTPILVRNLTLTGKRKMPGKHIYVEIKPELIKLQEVLEKNELTHDQLIAIALMIGTDFNPGGIKGIGIKRAMEIVKNSENLDEAFNKAGWREEYEKDWKELFRLFKEMPVNKDYKLEWRDIDEEGLISFLVGERSFSEERIRNYLEKLRKVKEARKQSSLERFFK
ncbi:flap endonuclease-1 [Candidatus Woesearchaeota archaeon]|nr:flap endonuclease-1 [Candidatus Woesearchaeota archaeon]